MIHDTQEDGALLCFVVDNVSSNDRYSPPRRQKTALHCALEMGHVDVLELLVKHGAKVKHGYAFAVAP